MTVEEITDSPILSLIDRIFELRAKGVEVLGLHIGEPDFDTPQGIRDAAYRAMNRGQTHYVSARGLPELRQAVAHRLVSHHRIPATADDVVIIPAKFAIYASLLAIVGRGDEVLLPDPTYLFEQPTQLVGACPVYFPLTPQFRFDEEALKHAITPRSRVLILVSPGNPTGQVWTEREVRAAVEIAHDAHLTVVSDETYESLIYEGTHSSPASVAPLEMTALTIGSFSKMFSMTGWRAGYVVAPPPIRRRLVQIVEHTLTCIPPFIQQACLWGLENADASVEEFRTEFRRRRDHLLSRLDRVEGISYVRPEGAFYVFPSYELPYSSVEFCSKLLDEESLALVPGIAFGSRGEHHVRISYSSPIARLDEGIDRFARFLERHRVEAGSALRATPSPSLL